MEARTHRSCLWVQSFLLLVSDCGCDYRAESKEALRGVMATSGITTMRDYVEFFFSLEKAEKIVQELGILNYREKICM